MHIQHSKVPIQNISNDICKKRNIRLDLFRDDLCYPLLENEPHQFGLNGNKWRKLKYNIEAVKSLNKKGVVSFGGAFSNHLYALATAGKLFNFNTVGIVRGEISDEKNPTLSYCKSMGMELISWTRSKYKTKSDPIAIEEIKKEYPEYLIIPEGGSNKAAIKGASEIWDDVHSDYDHVVIAIGTGGTFCGLIKANKRSALLGIPVLKFNFHKTITKMLTEYGNQNNNWKLNHNFHFGGFAKYNTSLIQFINKFYNEFNIKLDTLYNGKMLFGIYDMIRNYHFSKGSKILCIHTGGLQGLDAFEYRFGADLLDLKDL